MAVAPKAPKAKTGVTGSVSKNIKQVVEKVNSSTNILVTVSRDPSVDELSAALGLTAMLDKLGKHGTAIYSGATPPAIEFLNPDAVFEDTADSLRDFIVAINKDKADHLRYKVDGDVVKIFITPYKTPITEEDLEFSQGDYNVELVFAIGAENQDDLDAALAAHGRILHDAAVIGVGCGENKSSLGSIEWYSEKASSFSEMIADLADLLKSEETGDLVDEQVATALLTGIVAATDRFSNLRTTSHIMTLAAQLMSKGADQQLIAARLQETREITETVEEEVVEAVPALPKQPASDSPVELSKTEESEITLDLSSSTLPPEEVASTPTIDTQSVSVASTESQAPVLDIHTSPTGSSQVASAYALESEPAEPTPPEEPKPSTVAPSQPVTPAPAPEATPAPAPAGRSYVAPPPEEAEAPAEDPKSSLARPQEKVIAPLSSIDRIIQPLGDSYNGGAADSARQAIEAALAGQTQQPSVSTLPPAAPSASVAMPPQPAMPAAPPVPGVSPGLAMPPPLPDFSTLPPPPAVPGAVPSASGQQPQILGDIFAPETQQPSVSTLPPAAPSAPVAMPAPPPIAPPVAAPQAPNDPSQFVIPGQ